jgi:hypothetical protein
MHRSLYACFKTFGQIFYVHKNMQFAFDDDRDYWTYDLKVNYMMIVSFFF